MKSFLKIMTVVALGVFLIGTSVVSAAPAQPATSAHMATPIKHLVVIFGENVSFDHYFGTYPNAQNNKGEPNFHAQRNTPTVNGLNDALLNNNPNSANPQRLSPAQALTCDQDHNYTDEQKAFDHGLMDQFVQSASGRGCTDKSVVMDYYDGNTVTGLWNYAQHFAMSDNSFNTTFGPSTPGALNLISGQTHGVSPTDVTGETANGTVIGDPDPALDDCSSTAFQTVSMSGKNVGDLLNAQNVSWGWFEGGFRPTTPSVNGSKAVCAASHTNIGGSSVNDYIPHHQPFQYYASTANPHHLAPSSNKMIGQTDQANHQYDMTDFWASIKANHMPAVSFLKAPAFQDGHAGYSDPLDEQHFLVDTINRLQRQPEWSSTAVVLAYDDSDGWYDHVMAPILSQSNDAAHDALSAPGQCGTAKSGAYQDRCGYGPRLPLLVISPFAKTNFVDHSLTDQSSILRFIEDNWNLGRVGDQSFDALAGSLNNLFDFSGHADRLFLNPQTGTR